MEDTKKVKEKLSYEELENYVMQLQEALMNTKSRLTSINLTSMRLDFLFKVLDKETLFPIQFIDNCIAEIIEILDVKKEDKEDKETEE